MPKMPCGIYTIPMNAKWIEIAESLGKMLDSGIYRVWVAPLEGEIDNGCLHLFAPHAFIADWVKKHLLDVMRKAASPVLGVKEDAVKIDISVKAKSSPQAGPVSGSEVLAKVMAEPRMQASLPVRRGLPGQCGEWRFNFDDFVTGPSNKVAVAAARDMCASGEVRTLFVNAAPGLGKTHLAQAVGFSMTSGRNPLKVSYLTGEQFASRFVASMRSHELEDFKQYLCGLDVLLLEDVHFLQRKKAMQEMVLNVVKNLQAKGARVIFTSSFAPQQLQEMDSQLVSLFCSDILTNMDKPDIEMRKEILNRKAKSFQVILPDDVSDFISRRLSSDVRQLEACLKNMIFKARLLHSGLTLDLAMETVGQYSSEDCGLDLPGIVRLVCESFGLTELQLKSRSRKHDYVQGRNTVFYLARKHTEMSLEEIGCIFNRKHSTVLRGITQMEQEISGNSRSGRQMAKALELIERKCGLC